MGNGRCALVTQTKVIIIFAEGLDPIFHLPSSIFTIFFAFDDHKFYLMILNKIAAGIEA